ncbi:HNH endonuclease signature motif containing protein [Pseudomonas canadensis]|uniref:HNH endonuclease n=1 Tax=Pseudomonas canadensis TaxID=915099 RepID=UPI002B2463C8|nr:HNH endonuclease signature motif containing protein [Pseudomonas canadensis]MEB2647331.1 HNH endonuclease signature motif containing protein [Pseudomonas canadensis]
MIFIKRSVQVRFQKKAWLRKKFRLVDLASNAKKRSSLIGELAAIPSWLTSMLVAHGHQKCWYCERKLPRSELVIEHFRPKRRVTNVQGHPGYYWLSANIKNFRIACKNCNCRWTNPNGVVAGKGNYFPLIDETKRVSVRNKDLRAEEPLLYDPLCQADCEGLIFVEDGSCLPAADDYVEVNRAFSSIALYNLNNPSLVDARKKIFGDVYLQARLASSIRLTDPHLFSEAINNIRVKAQESSEYASLVRSTIRKINSNLGVCI